MKHLENTGDNQNLLYLFNQLQAIINSGQSQTTIKQFIIEYKSYVNNKKSLSYCRSIGNAFNHFTSYFPEEKVLRTISVKDVEEFIIYLKKKVTKGYPVYFRNLKAAFSKAKRWNDIINNPFTEIQLDPIQKNYPIYIETEQVNLIIDHIERPTIKLIVLFAFLTGLRISEITSLCWSNIEFKSKLIIVGSNSFTTKSRKLRSVPMCNQVFDLLEGLRQKKESFGSVFTKNKNIKFNNDHISKVFKRSVRGLRLDNRITFHTLRHSFASNLLQKGVPLYVIKDLLGHASIKTTEIYAHLSIDSLRSAVNKLNSSDFDICQNKQQKEYDN